MADDDAEQLPPPPPAYEQLRPAQRDFVDGIVARKSYAEAYSAAYPKANHATARRESRQLLKKPHIRAAILEREAEVFQEVGIRTEQILMELAKVAYMDISPQTLPSKVRALQLLGLNKQLFGLPNAGATATAAIQINADGQLAGNDSRVQVEIVRFTDAPMEPFDRTKGHLRLVNAG